MKSKTNQNKLRQGSACLCPQCSGWEWGQVGPKGQPVYANLWALGSVTEVSKMWGGEWQRKALKVDLRPPHVHTQVSTATYKWVHTYTEIHKHVLHFNYCKWRELEYFKQIWVPITFILTWPSLCVDAVWCIAHPHGGADGGGAWSGCR